ncbi:unnamed protein product, partial [Ectocarpus sp. 4 AP-2014]
AGTEGLPCLGRSADDASAERLAFVRRTGARKRAGAVVPRGIRAAVGCDRLASANCSKLLVLGAVGRASLRESFSRASVSKGSGKRGYLDQAYERKGGGR